MNVFNTPWSVSDQIMQWPKLQVVQGTKTHVHKPPPVMRVVDCVLDISTTMSANLQWLVLSPPVQALRGTPGKCGQ